MNRKYIGLLLILIAVAAGYFLFLRSDFLNLLNFNNSRHIQEIQDIQELVIKAGDCDAALVKTDKLISNNEADADAWHWRGVCQFQLGLLAEAQQSFEKVVALNPDSEVAKKYLELISSNGGTLINIQKDGISREAFETLSRLQFPSSFSFEHAYPVDRGVAIVTTGRYTTRLSGGQVQVELEKSLKSAGISYTLESGGADIKSYEASVGDVSYKISINILSIPVSVAINITQTK